jgi:hypothetical protein
VLVWLESACTICAYNLRVQSASTIRVYNPCVQSVYNLRVQSVQAACTICVQSTICVYKLCVQSVCTICVYKLSVQAACTIRVYNLRVQAVCTSCVYNPCVQSACTSCRYKLRVQSVSPPPCLHGAYSHAVITGIYSISFAPRFYSTAVQTFRAVLKICKLVLSSRKHFMTVRSQWGVVK